MPFWLSNAERDGSPLKKTEVAAIAARVGYFSVKKSSFREFRGDEAFKIAEYIPKNYNFNVTLFFDQFPENSREHTTSSAAGLQKNLHSAAFAYIFKRCW